MEESQKMTEETGADGVMVARAALYDPHVFAEIAEQKIPRDIRRDAEEQIAEMLPFYGEKFTVVQMRKMVSFYIRGMRGCAEYRKRLFAADTLGELRALLDEIFCERG